MRKGSGSDDGGQSGGLVITAEKANGGWTYRQNRSPKGNMWSAIPVALLCLIVNWSERKQGSGPEGDKVLQNTGGLSFVLPGEVDEMR